MEEVEFDASFVPQLHVLIGQIGDCIDSDLLIALFRIIHHILLDLFLHLICLFLQLYNLLIIVDFPAVVVIINLLVDILQLRLHVQDFHLHVYRIGNGQFPYNFLIVLLPLQLQFKQEDELLMTDCSIAVFV